ncbi:MAG: chorismate mutase [Gemmatimonadales bacterium]
MTGKPADDELRAELDRFRGELDRVDSDLIRLIARRLELGLEAGRIKRALGQPVIDPEREASVLEHARTWAREAKLPEDQVTDIVQRLISLSSRAQLESI